ncbi:hypothetical protein ALC57_15139 [Trachymyrmex cornetzi]|uniref:Uncharacterized protein n=1 Tax=Trachymyrmex cornetzi TaxID=471704 RepID=A0A151IXG7_9HYME|nr:hypothetical protein ALC57_15139 [Trachymyrmex cornetzi]
MESQNKELSTKSTENSLEQLLDEDEDVFDETGMGSIIDLIYQTWITNTFVKNVRMMIGCIKTYMMKQRKIDTNTIRMREAKTMKDALLSSFLESLKTRGLLNSMYSMEELNRFFSTPESKVLQNMFMEDFITKNTFFEWLHDLKEYVRCHMATLSDASNIDREIFTSSAEVKSGGMNALFASTSKEQTDGVSQYITKLENGHLYTVGTPEGQTGHQLIRLYVYDIHDIKNKEKNQWWKYAKLRTQFLTSSPRDCKQQMVNQLLDSVADDLMKVPSVTKERKNVSY